MKILRRLLCFFTGHVWSDHIRLGNLTIGGGRVVVDYHRNDGHFQRIYDLAEDNNVMVSLRICARCDVARYDQETNLVVAKRA